jgi:hypothetical protein
VLAILRASDLVRALENLNGALHELAAFALFATSCSLPRQEERALVKSIAPRIEEIDG